MIKRSNNYIETYTGKKFYILDPQPEDISIVDISHALSMMCRFTGHSKRFYSVAEHSVLVSQFSPDFQLWGLLHDASEAYLADMASPVKPLVLNYKELEKNVMRVICDKFNLSVEQPEQVHFADMEMLRVEAFNLMLSQGKDWMVNTNNNRIMLPAHITCYTPEQAKLVFLEKFSLLTGL